MTDDADKSDPFLEPPWLTIAPDQPLSAATPQADGFDLGLRIGPIYDILRHPETRLKRLYLTGSQIAELEPLKGLTSLERLYLNGTPVADLEPFKGLTSLRDLYVMGTRVSDESEARLQSTLPDLVIWR